MEIIDRFSREHHDYHGLTRGRKRETLAVLRDLATTMGKPLEECEHSDLQDYLSGQLDTLHPNTVRRKRSMILAFYRWLRRVGQISAEQYFTLKEVPPPRESRAQSKPKPYSIQDLGEFYRDLQDTWPREDREWYLDRFRYRPTRFARVEAHTMHLQVRAITALAITGGLRRSEIRRIAIEDMHHENEYIVIRHPAKKRDEGYRLAPHTDTSRRAVRDWLEWRAQMFASPANPGIEDHGDPWLTASKYVGAGGWLGPMGRPRWASILHLNGRYWSLHRFRHTCGTNWLRAGMRLDRVQKLLGHASIQQTLAYAEVASGDVIADAEKLQDDFSALLPASA